MLSSWAWGLLSAETLEGKLVRPPPGDEIEPSRAWVGLPSRPGDWRWVEGHDGLALGNINLRDEAHRAAVLHTFLSHELLALELMALMLVRFPGAPPAFRRGLAKTMGEEQDHLERYRDRLVALGGRPGMVPTSGYFWRCLAEVPDPVGFVAGMSLGFEQANLDFARQWIASFGSVGDHDTVRILERVHDDEIGHVGWGWGWFRRFSGPVEDVTAEWTRHLRFPLSPARARGSTFDAEARRRAGLPEDLIEAVRVASASRGRPPRVFWFNPGCEDDIGAPGRAVPQAEGDIQRDLCRVAAVFARDLDVALVDAVPSPRWIDSWRSAGGPAVEWVADSGLGALAERRLAELEPWGRSPALELSHGALRAATRDDRPLWDPRWRALSDKSALPSLREALRAPGPGGGDEWVAKAPWSTSGGARKRWRGEPDPSARAWIERCTQRFGGVQIEPWVPRVLDLSAQVEVGPSAVRLVGLSRMANSPAGIWAGQRLGAWDVGLEPALKELVFRRGWPGELKRVALEVGARAQAAGYAGTLGIDAYVYRRGDDFDFVALSEVNLRRTFGQVALSMGSWLDPTAGGWLLPLRHDHLGAEDLEERLSALLPARRTSQGWLQGALWLRPLVEARRLGLVAVVGPQGDLDAIGGVLPLPQPPRQFATK